MGKFGRMYNARWRKARETFLRSHPFCAVCCKALHGADAVVDHIRPHRGDTSLFWDSSNWQALCKTCHDTHKQRVEKGGCLGGYGADGMPTDVAHPWNR